MVVVVYSIITDIPRFLGANFLGAQGRPLPSETHDIIDIGTGTGVWALEVCVFSPPSIKRMHAENVTAGGG